VLDIARGTDNHPGMPTETPSDPRLVELEKRLGSLSRRSYLLLYATLKLPEVSSELISSTLSETLAQATSSSPDDYTFSADSVNLDPKQIQKLAPDLASFASELLLVAMEAMIHGFMSELVGDSITGKQRSLEELLAVLWPAKCRKARQKEIWGGRATMHDGQPVHDEHWSVRDIMLLAEIRNAIVHGDGVVRFDRSNRLSEHGWSETDLALTKILATRTINDVLRFRRAVRTLANEVVQHQIGVERGP